MKLFNKVAILGVVIIVAYVLIRTTDNSEEIDLSNLNLPEPVNGERKEQSQTIAPPQATEIDIPVPNAIKKIEESDFNLILKKFYNEALATLKKPVIGKKYKLWLSNGSEQIGRLVEVKPGAVVMKVPYGKITYTLDRLSGRTFKTLFPEKAAQKIAMAKANQYLQQKRKEQLANTPKPPKATNVIVKHDIPTPISNKEEATRHYKEGKYDTSAGKTPRKYKNIVNDMGNFLNYQTKRQGAATASKLHVKKQGTWLVLYLNVTDIYTNANYNLRYTVADALWYKWTELTMKRGAVKDQTKAHIVLLNDKNKIVGGSSPKDSSATWVKRGKKRRK